MLCKLDHRIGQEVAYDPIQTVAPSASRLGAHFVLERLQALLAHVSTPALEPIAQELESLARLLRVTHACLAGVTRRSRARDSSSWAIGSRAGVDTCARRACKRSRTKCAPRRDALGATVCIGS